MGNLFSQEFKPRLYQETIFNTAAKSNTLVVLPTGLGKTAIAAMLIAYRLGNYPGSKALFLAPTKPLAQQHQKTLRKLLSGELRVSLFTGSVTPEKRRGMWAESDVVVSTPQGLENDVIGRKMRFEDVSLLVFDEAHRAVGDYAYVYLAKKYSEHSKHTRILALTASPGSDADKILEVCANLRIEDVEYRGSDAPDVSPYVQDMDVSYLKVELPEEMKKIKAFLEKSYASKLEEASGYGYVRGGPDSFTKTSLLAAISGLHGNIAKGDKSFELLKTVSLLAEAMKVQHAVELVETQGIFPLTEYFSQLERQALTTSTKSVKNLVKDINFRSAMILARGAQAKGLNHPKFDVLKQVVSGELAENPSAKIMVFTQFRDSAVKIREVLSREGVSCELFFGQAKKKNEGLSQRQQKEMLEAFEREVFSCLIATSVGEEGLDIPEVDLVVFYEPIPSAIRTVQRRGRTGRQKEGKVITLVTKNTRDEGYRWVAHHKEKRMYRVLETIRARLKGEENVSPGRGAGQKKLGEQDYGGEFSGGGEAEAAGGGREAAPKGRNTKIIVDYREKGSPVMRELLDMNVDLELANLNIGDYHISEHVVVEYKLVKDFVDSIIDGRLLGQAKELKQHYQPIIILEGEEDIYSQRKIHPNAVRGAIAALTIGFRIPVIRTRNPRDTAAMIKVIAEREQKHDDRDFQMHAVKPLGDREIQEYIISSFPGVGSKLAPHLLGRFGSVKGVVNADVAELKKVELIGEKKAKRIKEIVEKDYEGK
jgi:Fanconi anemia group M protein